MLAQLTEPYMRQQDTTSQSGGPHCYRGPKMAIAVLADVPALTGTRYSWTLQWRHNGRDGVSNHQPRFGYSTFIQAQIKENIKAPCHWSLCGNSPVTGEFPTQKVSNAEYASIWWRHHGSLTNAPCIYGHQWFEIRFRWTCGIGWPIL